MKNTLVVFLSFISIALFAQETKVDSITTRLINLNEVRNSNEDFSGFEELKELLKDVEIVMLGEQSHGEKTTYETKIKLVKFLHQEMGFDILAFESGFYDCQKAWELMQQGEESKMMLGHSVMFVWSIVKEFRPMTAYIEKTMHTERPLIVSGFDHQLTGKLSKWHYVPDLKKYLSQITDVSPFEKGLEDLNLAIKMFSEAQFKKYKKAAAKRDTAFIETVIKTIRSVEQDSLSSFWIRSLTSTKLYLSDIRLKTDHRDEQMAKNLSWLKEQNPGKKIICWGATSHFLYNSEQVRMKYWLAQMFGGKYYKKHQMMGDYVKAKYKSKVYTIGFIAHEGSFGLTRKKEIKTAKEKSLENIIGKTNFNNCLLPLEGLTISPYHSRPLGNYYMKNDIAQVMDAVIFNRNMEVLDLDNNLFLQLYPENKWIKPETSE